MLRRKGRGTGWLGGDRYLATVYCSGHELDIAALERYAGDGRPRNAADAVASITAGECPACPPRYVAGDPPVTVAASDGSLRCECCETTWYLEGDSWVAITDGGLDVLHGTEPIPSGATIDSGAFRVCPVDPVQGPADVVRSAMTAFAAKEGEERESTLTPELLDELVEGLVLAYAGEAQADAEVYRVLGDSGLAEGATERWQAEAFVTLHDIRRYLGSDT